MRTPLLRRSALAALFVAPLLLAGSRLALAEDPPPPANPPAEEPSKPKKADHDDKSLFQDWKIVKTKGIAHAKDRVEYWESTKVAGKDLVWLGHICNWANELDKAEQKLEAFLKYVPEANLTAKDKENIEKNHENAYQQLWQVYGKQKEWAKVVDAADRYRKDFPVGGLLGESWELQGRATRMAGDDDKALVSFKNAADLKMRIAVTDLVDVHMANGKIDEAKAIIEKYMQEEIVGKEVYFPPLQEFLNLIGSAAPTLEKAVSVGKTEAPADWKSKTAVFYQWTMQTNGGDQRLQRVEGLRRAVGDTANVAGLSTYNKYDPQKNHTDEAMTDAQEIDWYKAFLQESKYSTPPCIVVPKDVMSGLKQKFEGQFTILDGEGKFRWVRLTDTVQFDKTTYEIDCVALAVKKLAERAGGTPPSDGK